MEKIVYFFENIRSWQRTVAVVLGLGFFWLLESYLPLVHFRYNKLRHAGLNLFFTLTTVIVNFIFAFLIILVSRYEVNHQVGLLYLFPLPLWAFTLIGLMVLDLVSAWLIHWIQHKTKWMWRFHLIHHADTWVDTTTANRHHPVESVFRAVFTLLAVAITGAPIWLIFFYQFLSVLLSQFNHANIALPKKLDKVISLVLVTPGMHRVHHHYQQPLTDTNYGNIFSIWDRLFGTFSQVSDPARLIYGIDTHMDESENDRLGSLLKIPFEEYRKPPGAKFAEEKKDP